jgi:hypothetical protein
MRPLAAHCPLGLGKLFNRTGDRAKADEHLTIVATMYREMDHGLLAGEGGGGAEEAWEEGHAIRSSHMHEV